MLPVPTVVCAHADAEMASTNNASNGKEATSHELTFLLANRVQELIFIIIFSPSVVAAR
jgi:hypothetical protein